MTTEEMILTRAAKVRARFDNCGIERYKIADYLCINSDTLKTKIELPWRFSFSEVIMLQKTFNLSFSECKDLFYFDHRPKIKEIDASAVSTRYSKKTRLE